MEGSDLLIIGGGIGMAPLRPVSQYCVDTAEKYGKLEILCGARTAEDIVYKRDLEEWAGLSTVSVTRTVDPGVALDCGSVVVSGADREETARLAREGGFGFFTTTLSISPHKDAALLNEIGGELGREFCVAYLEADWKKGGGFRRSCELSSEHGLYRQTYCGCLLSLTEKRLKQGEL
jgi:hypothetical protein